MCVMLESCHIAGTSPRRTRGVKNLLDGFGKFIDEFFNDLWPYFVWAHSVISLKFQKLLTLFTGMYHRDVLSRWKKLWNACGVKGWNITSHGLY